MTNEQLTRAAESLEKQAEQHENHIVWLQAELLRAEEAAKQARADAAAVRNMITT